MTLFCELIDSETDELVQSPEVGGTKEDAIRMCMELNAMLYSLNFSIEARLTSIENGQVKIVWEVGA